MILVSERLSKLEVLFDNLLVSLIHGRPLDNLFVLPLLIFVFFDVIYFFDVTIVVTIVVILSN